jgi:hypothetical protein
MAALAIVASAEADDVPGPSFGDSYVVPSPPPVYGPPLPRRGNSFRIISDSSIEEGGSRAGYSIGGGPMFRLYHAESAYPWTDAPAYSPHGAGGIHGPLMLDVLLFTDISSRF